ncbi:hypothetical protein OCL06_01990 [Alteromonas sp. ASW11-19]|uniref:Uncharacterized protein n=1 Tax=Alteromonas salexigens TaxID=2982530 RepID=A0ABT2VN28_9ALTE|nr:hypothetical protein [Alteromonas salexigens]MCU7553364.1 hypothetical protein [Alteromonas salexigens]
MGQRYCGIFGLLMMVSPLTNADELADRATAWMSDIFNSQHVLEVDLTKQKIRFNGCKQKAYQLAFSQQLTKQFSVEANLHYDKGELRFGVLRQKVSSKAVEVISWWHTDTLRLGLGHKVITSHKMSSPMTESLSLPTSQALGVHLEMPGMRASHNLALSLQREVWEVADFAGAANGTSLRDNQLNLQYAIAF